MSFILGIDPGVTGALALFANSPLAPLAPLGANVPPTIAVFEMPILKIKEGGSLKSKLNLHALAQFLDLYHKDIRVAVIEDVHSMPGQGVSSSFNFGFTAGALQSAIVMHGIPLQRYRPAVWKKDLGLTKDKDSCRRRASELFPHAAHHWARKMDDGKAEAVLLAYFGSMRF